MKIPKVKIEQFGQSWRVRIDGRLKSLDQLTVLCNIHMRRLKSWLNNRHREQIIRDLILKAQAGVIASSKTHWYEDTPMWIPLVVEKAGISRATASYRVINWKRDGDMKRLMRPVSVAAPKKKPKSKPPAVVQVKTPITLAGIEKLPAVKPKSRGFIIAPKPESKFTLHDEDDFESLSDKPRVNLNDIPGPTEYERNL